MSALFIRREPVVNRHKTIIATRLELPAASATEAVVVLRGLADVWPDARSVMVALDACALDAGLMAWSPPANVMIEVPFEALELPETRGLLEQLQGQGIALSLRGMLPDGNQPGVSFRFMLTDFATHRRADNPMALPLAHGLADTADFDTAVGNGYAGAAGWFFLHGEHPFGPLKTNHAQAVRVLNLVRKNAEVGEVEAALKQDVTLSFKLLKYINSAAFGLGREIQSFRHAVTLLGYDKLNKWLSLLLVTASKSPIAPALMQTAIARGRFMEIVGAERFDAIGRDNLFITGSFSLLDLLLGARMSDVLAEMHLPPSVMSALADSTGEYAPYLKLALACEAVSPQGMIELAGTLGLTAEMVNRAQLAALAFADHLQID